MTGGVEAVSGSAQESDSDSDSDWIRIGFGLDYGNI